MRIDAKIRDGKLQNDISKEAAKILVLPSGKIDKYECLTGEEIPPSTRSQIIKQAKFAYSLVKKALEKQTEKQLGALKFIDRPNKREKLKQTDSTFSKICWMIWLWVN